MKTMVRNFLLLCFMSTATKQYGVTSFQSGTRSRIATTLASTAADQQPKSQLLSGIPFFGGRAEERNDEDEVSPSFESNTKTEMKSYKYNDWNLTYRFKPASPGFENAPPILMIPPVGIGMCSKFFQPTMDRFHGPAIITPNLIGCGVSEGSDPWIPDERSLSIPLDWVRGCEALMEQYFEESRKSAKMPWQNLSRSDKSFTVVAQGGLAPIGVLLAHRNPEMVQKLVLASPPTWKDMTQAVTKEDLNKNYSFFRHPIWGSLAFNLLETKKAVEFFSNLFLFSSPCDNTWIEAAAKESLVEARMPVAAFNSGFCLQKSLEPELLSLHQPILIIEGQDDNRERQEYLEKMKKCNSVQLPGKNVIPWEFPHEFADALGNFQTIET